MNKDYWRGYDDARWGSTATRQGRDYDDGVRSWEYQEEERRAAEASRKAAQEHEWEMERQRQEDADQQAYDEAAQEAAWEQEREALGLDVAGNCADCGAHPSDCVCGHAGQSL